MARTERDTVSTYAAADLLEVHPMTVRRWLEAGHLDGYQQPSGRWRVYRASVDKVLAEHAPPDLETSPY